METSETPEPLSMFASDVDALLRVFCALDALPGHVRRRAIAPRWALAADEPSLSAHKLRGYDARGELCFYRHRFVFAEVDFDCEDSPYPRTSFSETVTAVRTQSGIWLARTERYEPERGSTRARVDTGFHAISAAQLPR